MTTYPIAGLRRRGVQLGDILVDQRLHLAREPRQLRVVGGEHLLHPLRRRAVALVGEGQQRREPRVQLRPAALREDVVGHLRGRVVQLPLERIAARSDAVAGGEEVARVRARRRAGCAAP